MDAEKIRRYITDLLPIVGIRPVMDMSDELIQLYARTDYTGMMGLMQRHIALGVRIQMAYVKSGGPDAPIWTESPSPFPEDETKAKVTVFVRKSYLEGRTFPEIAILLAYILAVVCLMARRKGETTPDNHTICITAMMLGFGQFFRDGITDTPMQSESELAELRVLGMPPELLEKLRRFQDASEDHPMKTDQGPGHESWISPKEVAHILETIEEKRNSVMR